MSTHETSSAQVTVGSDRKFGVVFAVLFTIVGFLPVLHGGAIRWWAPVIAAGFGAAAWLAICAITIFPNLLNVSHTLIALRFGDD